MHQEAPFMKPVRLSYNSRKALMVHLGETAGAELANLVNQLAAQIEELQKNKVSVTRIVPQPEGEEAADEPR
jgi:hypothetical protein